MFKDHQDIWQQIWVQICAKEKGCISVIKTKAHSRPEVIPCQQLRWAAVANNFVDQIATNMVRNWQPVFSLASNSYSQIRHNLSMHRKLLDLHTEINQTTEETRVTNPVVNPVQIDFRKFTPNQDERRFFTFDTPILHCQFGDEFLSRVVKWARALRWPINPSSTGKLPCLSSTSISPSSLVR